MRRIPIGVEDFKRMIERDFYYIDKTEWINDVLNEEIALYTRPRRFGKTLNMSMLYHFFSNKEDGKIFDGLNITHHKEAMKHMNQYPTIFISLKDMKSLNMNGQIKNFSLLIQKFIRNNKEIMSSTKIDVVDKDRIMELYKGIYDVNRLKSALEFLCECLKQHYGKNVILLIDEYDVPLQSAYKNRYYDDMVDFIGGVFSAALKSNTALEKGILTGCLRISKESIFTGLNNFSVYSMMQEASSTHFGFTQEEVNTLLDSYHLGEYKEEVKVWYDGYQFASTEIYNPWSVLKYVNKGTQETPKPECFWANTSGNDLVMDYISQGNAQMQEEFESLLSGKTIIKELKLELTYKEMDKKDNVYSFLLLTGYLKVVKDLGSRQYELKIPNHEIKELYETTFMDHFRSYVNERKNDFVNALLDGNVSMAQKLLGDILFKHISYFDNQEIFYHGLLMGMLVDYGSDSNKEIGEGRPDIVIYPSNSEDKVIVIECKHSKEELDLEKDSILGANQIVNKKYVEGIKAYGYRNVIGYGMSFYKKRCHMTLVE